jgi:hypothetical protein
VVCGVVQGHVFHVIFWLSRSLRCLVPFEKEMGIRRRKMDIDSRLGDLLRSKFYLYP